MRMLLTDGRAFHALVSTSPSVSPSAGSSGSSGSTSPSGPVVLNGTVSLGFAVLLLVLFLAVGALVLIARVVNPGSHTNELFGPSVIRSWMAIAVAGAVLVLAAASFLVDDPTSRSTLIGAVVATLGSVTAFYFASKQSENAIAANATAAGTAATVPDLSGKTYQQARAFAGGTTFAVQVDPASAGDLATAVVTSQDPKPGASAAANSSITVTLGS